MKCFKTMKNPKVRIKGKFSILLWKEIETLRSYSKAKTAKRAKILNRLWQYSFCKSFKKECKAYELDIRISTDEEAKAAYGMLSVSKHENKLLVPVRY